MFSNIDSCEEIGCLFVDNRIVAFNMNFWLTRFISDLKININEISDKKYCKVSCLRF